jgi:predicted  nucleic acid-binding Zn-ribbon protein
MTTFIRRKTAENMLPFYNEDDAFFKYILTNNSVSNVSKAEFQKIQSLNDSMNKTIHGLKSENVALILKNQRLKNFNENLQNEISLKKSQICNFQEALLQENNSLKEKLSADSSKLEKMDKLILEYKKLSDDYVELRLQYKQKAYDEALMTESLNDQIDDLKNKNQTLTDEITQLRDRTKYLCRKRGNSNQDLSTACETGFPHEYRSGSKFHHGRQQGQRGQYNRSRRY